MIGGPALFGAICGVLLGASKSAYLIASILAIGGGFFAGFEHAGARGGALRGLCGGTLFGTFILLAHEAIGNDAKADLPHPGVLLVVATAVFGVILVRWAGCTEAGSRPRRKLIRNSARGAASLGGWISRNHGAGR